MSPGIVLIGYGAIARSVVRHVPSEQIAGVLMRPGSATAARARADGFRVFEDVAAALATAAGLFVECAGHAAVAQNGPAVLGAGRDFLAASVGALVDDRLRQTLADTARGTAARLLIPAGAVAGVDGLAAARHAGLERVAYTGRKPPRAWIGTPAERACDLARIDRPTVVFAGSAREAARAFPKNANVAATIAIAGRGLDETTARLIADPAVARNVHEIEAEGAFGALSIRVENNPSPDNPKTSALVALSIARVVLNRTAAISV